MERILKKLEHESLREAYFLTVALILAFGILQTTGTALQTDQPVVSVVSCSMYPALGVGDVLVVYGEEYDDIEVGDIAVYEIKEAELTVDDESFYIQDYDDSGPENTPAGDIRIKKLVVAQNSNARGAILKIGDETVRMSEGETVQINGHVVTLEEAVGMNIPVVHRVVEKNPDFLQTKGDNNERQIQFEKEVRPEQIHGTMLAKVPKIGGLKLLFMDVIGFSGDRPLVIDTFPNCTT